VINFGESLLHIMAKNAPDKLLAEEDLALFKLVKDIAENEQIVRASITDKKILLLPTATLIRWIRYMNPQKDSGDCIPRLKVLV